MITKGYLANRKRRQRWKLEVDLVNLWVNQCKSKLNQQSSELWIVELGELFLHWMQNAVEEILDQIQQGRNHHTFSDNEDLLLNFVNLQLTFRCHVPLLKMVFRSAFHLYIFMKLLLIVSILDHNQFVKTAYFSTSKKVNTYRSKRIV